MTREEQRALKKEKIEDEKRDRYYSDDLAMPPECEPCCMFRSCYNKYENKCSYTPGRGYTSYYSQFYPACGTRLNSGCPCRDGSLNDSFNMNAALQFVRTKLKESMKKETKKRDRERMLFFLEKLLENMETLNRHYVESVKHSMWEKEKVEEKLNKLQNSF